jgi:hypothetical protein
MEKPKFYEHWLFCDRYGREASFYDKRDVDIFIDKLFKDAVAVTAHTCNDGTRGNVWHERRSEEVTHQALLIGIEEIEPKTCDHKIVVIAEGINGPLENVVWGCGKCGKKLRAKWESVDE